MEKFSELVTEDDQMELPPGFRFHPSDEELITHYLSHKVLDSKFSATAIGEVDMNKVEPWELPWKAKMGEQEWYFFCVRDKKYPTGLRTNRATAAGYWKATGKDKDIFRGKYLVGMKKTLVFYKGRAPKGEKSNWVIHEYRLDGKLSLHNLPKTAKNEWVICRVFKKSSGGKKIHISGLVRSNSMRNDTVSSLLPPLVDSLSISATTKPTISESPYVPCFSSPIDIQKEMISPIYPLSSTSSDIFPNSFSMGQYAAIQGNWQYLGMPQMQDHTNFKYLFENYGSKLRDTPKAETDIEVNTENSSAVSNLGMGRRSCREAPSTSVGGLEIDDCIWNYSITE